MTKQRSGEKKKRGNVANLKPFVKGDPRINRTGQQKKLPILKMLMTELLGHKDGEDITKSELGKVVKAMIEEAKKPRSALKVQAAKEILDRTFGKAKSEDQPTEEQTIIWKETKTYKKL